MLQRKVIMEKKTIGILKETRSTYFSPSRVEVDQRNSPPFFTSPSSTLRNRQDAEDLTHPDEPYRGYSAGPRQAVLTESTYSTGARQLGSSGYRSRSSPTHGERLKGVERMGPLGNEEDRESRQTAWQRDKQKGTVGYTVAQYGDSRERRPEVLELDYSSRPLEKIVPIELLVMF